MAKHTIKITASKMVDCTAKHLFICEYCKQEFESRGEKLINYGNVYAMNEFEEFTCDWCNEDGYTELTEVSFE